MSKAKPFSKTLSRKSFFLFLLGVFFIFITVGFAGDIAEMGLQPTLRFAVSLLLSGIFPVCYAVAGFALRKQFWKGFLPLFALHFTLMNLLIRSLPSPPQPAQMDTSEIARLQHRLALDGRAIMLSVGLGYA